MARMSFKLRNAATIALLSTAALVNGQESTGPAWDHSLYTTSPPVYPSPNATGSTWEAAFAQASAFLAELTLEEKAQIVTGTPGPCTGNIGPIQRLNFSGLCLQDGPLAIRQATYSSVFPAGLTVAASWDRDLAKQRGVEMALEFRGKGAHIALGPVAGPLGRTAYGGRNWEGFSVDSYLTGILFADTIEAMQSTGVQACAKHYIGNEQETQRNPSGSFEASLGDQRIEAVSSNIDDRTMHETYLWPFANAVHSGVASVMCSYNRINGSYGCQNSKALNGILKDELDFQGYVMSDWFATHAGYQAADAGLDMDMPGGLAFGGGGLNNTAGSLFGGNLTMSVNNGSLAASRVDDMVRRIMTPYFYLQQQNYPAVDPSSAPLTFFQPDQYKYNYTFGEPNVDVRENHADLIRELGAAGIVLLKNENNALPLKNPQNIGVFGNDAGDLVNGLYFQGNSDLSNGYEYGVLPVGGGSGNGRLTYVVSPLEALKAHTSAQSPRPLIQYLTNNTLITSNPTSFSILAPRPPEVCLVFLNTWATEGSDRSTLSLDHSGNDVVTTIAANCNNTIVITHSGGINTLPFATNPNVTAILAAHYSGQEAGTSIIDILYGKTNPSGHLPYTIASTADEYSFAPITNLTKEEVGGDPYAWQSDFEERLLIDYKHFDYFDKPVVYEFGYGLSYTTFALSGLKIEEVGGGGEGLTARVTGGRKIPGGNSELWEEVYRVRVGVRNTGLVDGAAVPQLYLGLQDDGDEMATPVRQLRGFEKVFLGAGEEKEVVFPLLRRDISYWNTGLQDWVIGKGEIVVEVGFSSRDLKVKGGFVAVQ